MLITNEKIENLSELTHILKDSGKKMTEELTIEFYEFVKERYREFTKIELKHEHLNENQLFIIAYIFGVTDVLEVYCKKEKHSDCESECTQ